MLIRIVKAAFEHAGWRTSVDTGRWTFPLADMPELPPDVQPDCRDEDDIDLSDWSIV